MNTLLGRRLLQVDKMLWMLGALAVIILILAYLTAYTIGPGERGVLLNWGAVQPGSVMPGLHFKMPFQQSIVKLNVRVQKYQSQESAASKDLQDVTTHISINFHLLPNKVNKLYENVGKTPDLEQKILVPAASNAVKAITALYNAENLIENRNKIRKRIAKQIVVAMTPYNMHIDAVNITNFKFSGAYSTAIERKQVAQQRALQAKYELSQTQIDAQQQVVKAKAKAKATLVAAHAEAKALTLKRKAVTPDLIMLNAVAKWDGKVPSVITGPKSLPLLNLKAFGKQTTAGRH